MNNINNKKIRKKLLMIGILLSILMLWNGVCDYIYGYSPILSGTDYFSSEVFKVILSANGRPHWLITLAQSAGWLYPIYAITYFLWWLGMRKTGFWNAVVPNLLLAYAILMIGGIQHAGWAFLSVLEQAKEVVGSTDPNFYSLANKYIIEHFIMGDLTAMLALYIGTIWHAITILRKKTIFPRWFIVVSPFGILTLTMLIGAMLPAPFAGLILAPFGTWFLLFPNIAITIWLWKNYSSDKININLIN
jgi:hypothetical protein